MKEIKVSHNGIFSLSKIKILMQSNEKIGRIPASIPLLINRFLEILFTDFLCELIYFKKKKKIVKIRKIHLNYIVKKLKRFKNLINVEI
jgi:hypothetical protein